MKCLKVLAFIFLNAICVHSQIQQCFDQIKQLALKDKCLSSRLDLKKYYAKIDSKEMFVTHVSTSKCNGTAYACGLTRSWVSEVFVGLAYQYNDSKYDMPANGSAIGYEYLVGDQLKNLFDSNKNSGYPIIYQLRFVGDEDHDWLIEQLPLNNGYRVYQSYHDAFSLNAWLSSSVDGLYNAVNGDIMMFNQVKEQANQLIQMLTNGQQNLTSNSLNLPAVFIPFIQFIRDYNETQVVSNFKSAWKNYGRGSIIPTNQFNNYVNVLAEMTSYFKSNDNTTNPFSKKIWDDWIDLFGSPNPVHFPNLAHNALTNFITPGKTFRFEIKTIPLKTPPTCYNNAINIH